MDTKKTTTPAQIRLDIKRKIILNGETSLHKIMLVANMRSDVHADFIRPLLDGTCATPLAYSSRMPRMCFVQTFPEHVDDQNQRSFWEDNPVYDFFVAWAKGKPSPTKALDLRLALHALSDESQKRDNKLSFIIPTAMFVVEDASCPPTDDSKKIIKNLFRREALNGTTPFIIHMTSNRDKSNPAINFFENVAADCMGAYAAFAPDQDRHDLYSAGMVVATHALGIPSLIRKFSCDQAYVGNSLAEQIYKHHGALTL